MVMAASRRGRPAGSPDRRGRASRVGVPAFRHAAWHEVSEAFGARLREVREAHDVSVSELAAATGLATGTLHAWERGRNLMSWPALLAIAAALGEAPAALLPDVVHHRVLPGRLRKGCR